ncbi:MAG: penicillin-binding protein activator [Casimicrobiaceae bacterium]
MIAPRRFEKNAHVGTRWRDVVCAIAFAFALPALSAAQTPAASEPPPAGGVEAGPKAEFVPNGNIGAKTGPIVLVLPLASASFSRAAEAVHAGFLAAAEAAKAKPLVIGHGDGDILEAFAKAKAARARVIVGPLVRDDMKALVAAGEELPPTIALNQLDEGASLPRNIYVLTLTIDGEARQLARRARDDGAVTVVVIASDTPRQQRFASAFNAEWILAGGAAPVMYRFDPSPEVLRLMRRELAKSPVDAALLAVDAEDAARAKPYVGSIPSYTSSEVNERQSPDALRDLDNVRFVDIPWLVDADAAAFTDLKRPGYPNPTLERLYALGMDAFRVAQEFTEGSPSRLEFDGATGHLSLDETRQFVREGRLMQFRAGRIVPVGAR